MEFDVWTNANGLGIVSQNQLLSPSGTAMERDAAEAYTGAQEVRSRDSNGCVYGSIFSSSYTKF